MKTNTVMLLTGLCLGLMLTSAFAFEYENYAPKAASITLTPDFDDWWVNSGDPIADLIDDIGTSETAFSFNNVCGWGQDLDTSPTMLIDLGCFKYDIMGVTLYNGVDESNNAHVCSEIYAQGSVDGVNYEDWGQLDDTSTNTLTLGTHIFQYRSVVPLTARYIKLKIGWSPLPQIYSCHALSEVTVDVVDASVPVELSGMSLE